MSGNDVLLDSNIIIYLSQKKLDIDGLKVKYFSDK